MRPERGDTETRGPRGLGKGDVRGVVEVVLGEHLHPRPDSAFFSVFYKTPAENLVGATRTFMLSPQGRPIFLASYLFIFLPKIEGPICLFFSRPPRGKFFF
jgi:hypothetical protein